MMHLTNHWTWETSNHVQDITMHSYYIIKKFKKSIQSCNNVPNILSHYFHLSTISLNLHINNFYTTHIGYID